MTYNNWIYIAVMAAVSYAIRVLPLTLIRRPIKNQFIQSFLYYVLCDLGRDDLPGHRQRHPEPGGRCGGIGGRHCSRMVRGQPVPSFGGVLRRGLRDRAVFGALRDDDAETSCFRCGRLCRGPRDAPLARASGADDLPSRLSGRCHGGRGDPVRRTGAAGCHPASCRPLRHRLLPAAPGGKPPGQRGTALLDGKGREGAGAKLVAFSSDQVYAGVTQDGPLAETLPLSPANVYGQHKLEAEQRALELLPMPFFCGCRGCTIFREMTCPSGAICR